MCVACVCTVLCLYSTILDVSGGAATMKMKYENENSSRYSPVQQSPHRIPTPRRTTTATAHITPVTALAPNNKDIHCIRTRIRIIACTLLCTYLPPPTHTPTTITPYNTTDPHSYPRADPPRPPLIPMTDPDVVGALYRIASYRIVSFWPLPPSRRNITPPHPIHPPGTGSLGPLPGTVPSGSGHYPHQFIQPSEAQDWGV